MTSDGGAIAMADFTELHRELSQEFYFYLDKRGKAYVDSLMYYPARGGALAACALNLPGTKLLLTAQSPQTLTEQVRRALLFADHVIIRHRSLVPISGLILGSVPADFSGYGPLKWVERHSEELGNTKAFPFFRNPPPPDQTEPFIDWLGGEGREWFQQGLITYAPFIPSEDVEIGLHTTGIDHLLPPGLTYSELLQEGRILPNPARRLNQRAALALQSFPFPYLEGVDARTLVAVKREYGLEIARFQLSLFQELDKIRSQAGTSDFERDLDRVFEDLIAPGVSDVEQSLRAVQRTATIRRANVALTTCLIGLSFWLGAPAYVAAAALAKPVWDFVQSLVDETRERSDIANRPMYVVAKIRARRKRG